VVDGRYLIKSRIARGGMATVYLALDRRLDREVALKVMHEHLAIDAEFVSRFVHEARAAARLSHPNVVQVYDQGSDTVVLYLAMEYLPGRTLRDVLTERGALTPRESVSVLEPVLAALAAAHRAGIVHRDVKPENVILTDDGRIKVADFGLARAVTAPISTTATNELLGTVAYLAPELVSHGHADARADVYAAGIMLFELLTGKQPFTGPDPLQVAYRHVHEPVPAPSSLFPDLPAAFDQVVLRATDQNPDHRPPDAAILLADLHAAQARVPAPQLDHRAADAGTLRLDAARTQVFSALSGTPAGPAAATTPQPTRALTLSRRQARAHNPISTHPTGSHPLTTTGSRVPLLPRLSVHDSETAPPGFLGERHRQAIAAIAGALTLLLIIFTGIWWFTGGPGSYTTTPSLTGQRLDDAQRVLSSQGLYGHENDAYSTTVAAGQVISTTPTAGQHVKKNGTVQLTVSKGPHLIAIPDVTGKTVAEATTQIKAQGLTIGTTKTKFSGTVAKDMIISTSPKAGTQIAPDRPITLTVSKGAQPVLLDNVVGQNVDAATQLLKSKGLVVQRAPDQPATDGTAPGTVVLQDPAVTTPNQTVNKGSTVTLTAIAQPAQVTVPNVVGQQFDAAKQQLQQLGLSVNKQGGGFWGGGGNTVVSQSAVGPVAPGTQITLTVN